MTTVSIDKLLESGAHFGHLKAKWHPKMKQYIYNSQSGIYIIDLKQTLGALKKAYEFAYKISANGQKILFVGTKPQASKIIAEEAKRSDNFYVNHRWLGGMLTNFSTIKQSISKLKIYEDSAGEDGTYPGILKKEASKMEKERKKMELVLGGIKSMRKMPSVLFITDLQREHIAFTEAKKIGIPVIALVDTNCDPRDVEYIIPGNDDSANSIRLFNAVIAAASIEGRKEYEKNVRVQKEQKEQKKAEANKEKKVEAAAK